MADEYYWLVGTLVFGCLCFVVGKLDERIQNHERAQVVPTGLIGIDRAMRARLSEHETCPKCGSVQP